MSEKATKPIIISFEGPDNNKIFLKPSGRLCAVTNMTKVMHVTYRKDTKHLLFHISKNPCKELRKLILVTLSTMTKLCFFCQFL